jgi:glutamate/tyrosine decarboxylase-like PLP-dependent enzyme
MREGLAMTSDADDRTGQAAGTAHERPTTPRPRGAAERARSAADGGRDVEPIATPDFGPALDVAAERGARFLESLPDRPVWPRASLAELRERLDGELPDGPSDPADVVAELAAAADPGLVAMPGGRYFGFVIGGSVPAAVAADWLVSAWDQNAFSYVTSPAAAVIEEVARRWLLELLGLPADASVGFVTGAQMANATTLAAARHHVLAAVGWDVVADGLAGAPPLTVVVGAERHVTVDRALRLLGMGASQLRVVPADRQGRMDVDQLDPVLREIDGPLIVCAQVGNVNSGASDDVGAIVDAAHARGGWVHVDGAFGLWAAASERHRHLVPGLATADSWATDGHKWLNVPYDSGMAFCAHPDAHAAAMQLTAAYLVRGDIDERNSADWTPEASRRARGVPVYAALRSLGRSGIAELVDRCCAHAQHFARELGADKDTEVLNDVVLNQVLVRFLDPDGDHDGRTARVLRRIQEDGTCWVGGTQWQGMGAIRISVSNWSTTSDDVARSIDAFRRSAAAERAAAG